MTTEEYAQLDNRMDKAKSLVDRMKYLRKAIDVVNGIGCASHFSITDRLNEAVGILSICEGTLMKHFRYSLDAMIAEATAELEAL
jgi:hypothetical protein